MVAVENAITHQVVILSRPIGLAVYGVRWLGSWASNETHLSNFKDSL